MVSLNHISDSPDDVSLVAIQHNAAALRDVSCLIPDPIAVILNVNGQPARALLDSGSLVDFMSAKLAHQLGVQVFELTKPLPVHLAVQGSRTKINLGCCTRLEHQHIKSEQYFNILNLLNYDPILGTPFMFRHKISFRLNPVMVVVGSVEALPIKGKQLRTLLSHAAEVYGDHLEETQCELREYAAPICVEASDSPLPPLRAINHHIPLIDPEKTYPWCPSKCPDAHRGSWIEKRDTYLASGWWRAMNTHNTSLMLLLTKPRTGVQGIPPRLRVVCDLRERNADTRKLMSPFQTWKVFSVASQDTPTRVSSVAKTPTNKSGSDPSMLNKRR